ncbi:MAG: adenosylcobinamide-GDP ribazoletransferase [Pseudomonadota bacterium]
MRDALFASLTFYSRLPVPPSAIPLREAVAMAPVAGVIVALPGALALLLAGLLGLSTLFGAAFAVVVTLVITGALHEDGLADCADGLFGGATREKRLAIMRDSRIGTFGVLALIAAVLLKVVALGDGAAHSASGAALAFVAAAALSRAVALFPWVGLPPAREDGLAASFGRPTVAAFRQSLLIAIALAALATAWWAPIGLLVAVVAALAVAKGCAVIADRTIGGHTGDVIGATVVCAEVTVLTILTMFAL